MGVMVDPLTAIMLFFVSITCLCIFVYSTGYQNAGMPEGKHNKKGEPPEAGTVEVMYSRFFAYISLFAAAMLTLVVADNILLLFVGWEVMGLCSYLLIGFWFARTYPDPKRITPFKAAIKAFMTTRVGDVLMLLGIAYVYSQTGTLSFREIFEPAMLAKLAETPSYIVGLSVAGLAGLLLFAGTVGKSAQFPLHVWLPDAMEGPTPVSAMIHAATMVSAGVYAVVRMFPLLHAGLGNGEFTAPMLAMGLIGAFTALFASIIAVAQNDIKRVLAYSTIAQLGYMIAALGVGAWVAAAFHLMTHAFFKALLFLGSGSVIHGVEHGHHHAAEQAGAHGHDAEAHSVPFDANDMLNMGGLRKKMPHHVLDIPHRRAGAFGLSAGDGGLLEQGRYPGRRVRKDVRRQLAWHGRVCGAGDFGAVDRVLHRAPDQPHFPGQAAHRGRRARFGKRVDDDGAARGAVDLCDWRGLGRHRKNIPRFGRDGAELVP